MSAQSMTALTRCPRIQRLRYLGVRGHTLFTNIFVKTKKFAKPFQSVYVGPKQSLLSTEIEVGNLVKLSLQHSTTVPVKALCGGVHSAHLILSNIRAILFNPSNYFNQDQESLNRKYCRIEWPEFNWFYRRCFNVKGTVSRDF